MFATVVTFLSHLSPTSFDLSPGVESDILALLWHGYEDGSTVIIHSYDPMICISNVPGALAWTANPELSDVHSASISSVSIVRVAEHASQLCGSECADPSYVFEDIFTQALTVELMQQLYGQTSKTAGSESVAHGVSFACSAILAERAGYVSSAWEEYERRIALVNSSGGISISDPLNPVVGISKLTPEVFEELEWVLSDEPLLKVLEY